MYATQSKDYLSAALHGLRLRLERRVVWLRYRWQNDPLRDYQGMVVSDAQADWWLAGPEREVEQRFYLEEPTAVALTQAIEPWYAESGHPLGVLSARFGLEALDQQLLLLCLAPEIDPAFERLYAYVQDDVARKYPTLHLAESLFGPMQSRLSPQAPLRRFRLIHLEPAPYPAAPLGARPLRLDDRVAAFLLGETGPDPALGDVLTPLTPPAALTAAQLEVVRTINRGQKARTVQLLGTGGAAVAAEACRQMGLPLYRIDPSRVGRDLLPLLEREAILLPAAFAVETDHLATGSPEAGIVADLSKTQTLLFLVGREPVRLPHPVMTLPLPALQPVESLQLWQSALAMEMADWAPTLRTVVQQFRLGPSEIESVVAAARQLADLRDQPLQPQDLWESCRTLCRTRMDSLAQRLTGAPSWGEVVLPPDTVAQLREVAQQVEHQFKVYEEWGFGARLGRGRGTAALFSGPSGTGKTMAAELLAAHLKLDLYRIDLAGVVSKYIGETEKNLGRLFDAAEDGGGILFFDEADALFGKRTEVKDSHDRFANIEINYLLQRMEDYRGLAILATNMKSALDTAFLRRLRFMVEFPFPDPARRQRIWEQVFPAAIDCTYLDFTALSRLELAGGSIKNIALGAAFLAAAEGQPVQMAHVLHAARREYAKLDRPVRETEFAALASGRMGGYRPDASGN